MTEYFDIFAYLMGQTDKGPPAGNGSLIPYLMGKAEANIVERTASGAVAHITDAIAAPFKGVTAQITPVQSGSGDPSPDNVRPISGWNGVTITRTGKNLFGGNVLASAIIDSCTNATQDGSIVTLPNGAASVKSAASDRVRMLSGHFEAGQRYTVIIKQGSTAKTGSLLSAYYIGGASQSISSSDYDSETTCWRYVTASGQTVRYLRMNRDATGKIEYDVNASGIFKGSIQIADAASYEGSDAAITFPNDPGTVYGGTLSIAEDGSVTLTVTHGQIESYAGETLPGAWISSMDVYAPGTTPTTGAQVVYELAAPQTYTLTPITSITALAGENNVWADSGDVSVTYLADGRASNQLAVSMLLGRNYLHNPNDPDDATAAEALTILTGGDTR